MTKESKCYPAGGILNNIYAKNLSYFVDIILNNRASVI